MTKQIDNKQQNWTREQLKNLIDFYDHHSHNDVELDYFDDYNPTESAEALDSDPLTR